MFEYTVLKPFMARKGQFQDGHTLCIGIEKQALHERQNYRCYIGKNKIDYYDMDYMTAESLVQKYGVKNVVWHIKGKDVFILPIIDFKHGKHEPLSNNT